MLKGKTKEALSGVSSCYNLTDEAEEVLKTSSHQIWEDMKQEKSYHAFRHVEKNEFQKIYSK